MKTLNSIQPIIKEYPTMGSPPVEVLCNDFLIYLCKYNPHTSAYGLFREYIANQFLGYWGINVPQAAFVNIPEDHLPDWLSNRAQPRFFRIPTFGVQKHRFAKEVDNSLEGSTDYFIKLLNRTELLKIALFDLWVGNDDRNQGNYNLMIDSGIGRENPYFLPIDHWAIFNTGSMEYPICMQTYEDSLIYTSFFKLFCKNSPSFYKEIDSILIDFKLWKEYCKSNVDEILSNIPNEWNIDIDLIKSYLSDNIFRKDWIEEVSETFRIYLQMSLA